MKRKEVTEDIEWKDIDHEKWRKYIFPSGKRKIKIKIKKPLLLNVSESGGHRILDAKNVSHYIPYKWIHLYWKTNDKSAFRF